MNDMPLIVGSHYTRKQINAEVSGGDLQSYLPHSKGTVLCGCFDPRVNVRAPYEIDLGEGRDVTRYAERLLEQGTFIPVFLRRQEFAWEFVGRFHATLYTTDASDLYPAKSYRRKDALAVLYLDLEPCDSREQVTDDPSISSATAVEGGAVLTSHIRRERSRQLVEAKRRAHRVEHGHLSCEACGLSECELPPEIGEACFEAHHLLPLGLRQASAITKLDDLGLLCANCHRLIHRSSPMLSVRDLRKLRVASS